MRKTSYRPPYTVSGRAMGMMAEIGAALECYRILLEGPDGVRLRKINHVRTLRGTTAIEGNTLSEAQITAILAGKHVEGPRREIAEVECAHRAYLEIENFDPYSMSDLLKAHGLMTAGLVGRPRRWRNCNVGVVGANGAVYHMAPPWANVPRLMRELFAWLAKSEDPMLIKSCVFHYEFEFIHPFPDGNGRMGRLWQTALLGSWRRELYGVPVENIVWAHQAEYYAAIREATARSDSGPFIDFMLDKILRALKAKGEEGEGEGRGNQKSDQKSDQKIADLMRERPEITIIELAEATGLSVSGVKKNIRKLKDANRIRRVGPDKGGHWEVV